MGKAKLAVALALLLSACVAAPHRAVEPAVTTQASARSDVQVITDLKQALPVIAALPRASTLVVFDIDDTLLTSPDVGKPAHPQFFGSDRWYVWQSKELHDGAPDKVGCLFDLIALHYEAATQKATQPDAPAIVQGIAHDKLILTSRSPDYRGATERELAKAGFGAIPSLTGEGALMFRWPAGSGAYMTYANGIYMTRGANKGDALLALLERLGRRYDNVVLIDDGEKNIQAMKAALARVSVNYVGLRFEGVKTDPPPPVSAQQVEESRAAVHEWSRLLENEYPGRKARHDAECVEGGYGL